MSGDILIRGGRLVTMADGSPDEQAGDLLIQNGKIADFWSEVPIRLAPK